uniref:Ig-like domain-containing protein n=1 Tax=Neogobius melanostomus TaxID=47308 RepID=A0A8C6SGG8_9GOBI
MQENIEQQPSLSQLLRESYLEARAQQRHSEMSRSDASSSRLQIYGSLKGKAEASVGHSDSHFPDLSAFLSQEELDKSVNLARQAIGHEPRDVKTHSEIKTSNTTYAPDKKIHKSTRSPPYGPETQSKKEFLNKAADFIEELSSLFKANSTKRVRPRVCKAHRSRSHNKSQADGMVHPVGSDDRECTVLSPEIDTDRPGPLDIDESNIQPDCRIGDFENCEISEEKHYDTVPLEETEAENTALQESSFPADTGCEPPRFVQKLKSREVPEGSKVQLDCIVQGQPDPEVRWFCEGKELENSPDIQIITNGEHHSLIITEAFEEDTGRYSCFASNFYGTDSTSAEIYVEVQPSNSVVSSVFSVPSPALVQPPQTEVGRHLVALRRIIMQTQSNTVYSLQDLVASEGQLVVLECRVKGTPSPRVLWYKEGTLIADSPEFRILQKSKPSMIISKEICTLVIAEVFTDDSGTFRCTASNNYGSVSSTAELKVKGNKPIYTDPTTPSTNNKLPSNHQNGASVVVPLPDPPPNSCLKTGTLKKHRQQRGRSRKGLRVHFKLPEDEEHSEPASQSESEENTSAANKEPPPLLAKPKL